MSKLNQATLQTVPDAIVDALKANYASGFRFDMTYINLLASIAGVEIDVCTFSALRQIMFRRNDDVHFLIDGVASSANCNYIVNTAENFLEEFGCFEISELYKLCEESLNPNCIRNANDFEAFYAQICSDGQYNVATPFSGHRVVRASGSSIWAILKELAVKIISVIDNEYYGSCNEEDLQARFYAFSACLLSKIVKNCALDELLQVEINENKCYQTWGALGLPDNFSDVLAEALEQLNEIGLEPSQEVLHTTICLKLGLNFKAEYNLPEWDVFRRLIAASYESEPRREWKYNVFGEVKA